MLALLLMVIFGIFFSIIATQNTLSVPIQILSYRFNSVPLYLVLLLSLLVGVILSSGLSLLDWISTIFTIHGKDTQLKSTESTITRLQHRINELKEENALLRGDKEEIREESREKIEEAREHPHPGFIDRLRHSLSV